MSSSANIQRFLSSKAKYDAKAKTGPFGYHEDFAQLRQRTLQYRKDPRYAATAGAVPHNYRKNRYKDILPYDYTRVKLNSVRDVMGTDYINANYITYYGPGETVQGPNYIAAQGPLPNTVREFVRMLWEQNTKVVFMACNEFEGDPPKHKCERYWPIDESEELKFDDISVKLETTIDSGCQDYLIRRLQLECNGETHTIHHLHYTGWPDHGVPNSHEPIIDMIEKGRSYKSSDSLPVIHCSAGCGRTGTIIAIDIAWRLLQTNKVTDDFDLFSIINEIRTQRPSLVQSLEQYKFVFDIVAEIFERRLDRQKKNSYENVVLTSNDTHDTSSQENGEANINPMPKPPRISLIADQRSFEIKPKPKIIPRSASVPQSTNPVGATAAACSQPDTTEDDSDSNIDDIFEEACASSRKQDKFDEESLDSAVGTNSSKDDESYAYANPNQLGKWSLQHFAISKKALNNEDEEENPYSEVCSPSPTQGKRKTNPLVNTTLVNNAGQIDDHPKAPTLVKRQISEQQPKRIGSQEGASCGTDGDDFDDDDSDFDDDDYTDTEDSASPQIPKKQQFHSSRTSLNSLPRSLSIREKLNQSMRCWIPAKRNKDPATYDGRAPQIWYKGVQMGYPHRLDHRQWGPRMIPEEKEN